MTVTVMAAMLPELKACSTSRIITKGVVVSNSHITMADSVSWGVPSLGMGSAVGCAVDGLAELPSSVGKAGVVGVPLGCRVLTVELCSKMTEAGGISGGEVDVAGGEESGVCGEESGVCGEEPRVCAEEPGVCGEEPGVCGETAVEDSMGVCDSVVGTRVSGVAEPGLPETGVEWSLLLVGKSPPGEESWVVASHFVAVLVTAPSLGSVELFLGSVEVGAETAMGRPEELGVSLAWGSVSALVFCGELVQMVSGGVTLAGRETGKLADVGRL